MRLAALALLVALAACAAPERRPQVIATGEVVADFSTYDLRRVGLLPFRGNDMTEEQADNVQSSFFTEISRTTSFEVVPLAFLDLEEIPESDPYRRGYYKARTVLDLARRYNLDGVLVGTVTHLKPFPPLALSVQLELVAAETGQVVWSSTVHLDARDERVRSGMRRMYERSGPAGAESWDIALISPSRFSQFAAYQIAQLL